ncbi:MAG TPA: translation elongation factor Ts [Candidatus Dormibacteraeota bacterium]|nr:translation elongation factor Ts [Candidatus Dormibacteraeota bacterium]
MSVPIEDIKKLRAMTGAGMMSAKKALEEASGDIDKAIEVLRLQGQASAAKRADREAKNGLIEAYVHVGKIGALVELNCETDFVARTDDFKAFAKDIAMHVTATDPQYLSPDTVPEEVIEKEKELYLAELESAGKPDAVKEKIIQGKLDKYYEAVCLTRQPFVKDPDKTIEQLVLDLSAKVGENVVIRRFKRIELGGAE